MLMSLSTSDICHLGAIADKAIATSLCRAAVGLPKLHEVPAVEALVSSGLGSVAQVWRRSRRVSLPDLHLQTVFCHAAPKVSFTRPGGAGPGNPELADLLLIFDDPRATVPEDKRRAVLVQAKMHDASGRVHLGRSNEQVQFELLSAWPPFTFQTKLYKSHPRDFNHGPGDPSWSGEYGGIDHPPPGGWTQYLIGSTAFQPYPPIHGAVSLGALLAGMLGGRKQCGRPAVPYGGDPWSETVQELLDVTFNLPVRERQPLSRRGRDHSLSFTRDLGAEARWASIAGRAGGGGSADPPEMDERPEGAISVARFIIGEARPD